MTELETNLYPITNLAALTSNYRLYRINGLTRDSDEYEANKQAIIRKLRFGFRKPAGIITIDGEPHLALRDDAREPPAAMPLIREVAHFEKLADTFTLDFEHPAPETASLRTEFLQFAIQGALFKTARLWQPQAGDAFFERQGTDLGGIIMYRGFGVRVIALPDGNLGLCVDVQHKYVAKNPLPATMDRNTFRRYKHSRVVYHYGSQWYEIKLHDITGLSVSQQMIPDNGRLVSLQQYIMDHALKPLAREVTSLPHNSAALVYMTGRSEPMHAAAALCYPVFDTSDARIRRMHQQTILAPHVRRRLIREFVNNHLATILLDDKTVTVSDAPLTIKRQVFLPPDLAFGNQTVLSVRGTTGATYVSIEQLGNQQRDALFDRNIGTHATKPLEKQYLILPTSVINTHGPAFLEDLKRTVDSLYPQELPYDPELIPYDDLGPKTYGEQGRAILAAIDEHNPSPGFGIVMLHETVDRRNHEHDQLAAMVMRKLRDQDLYVSVIHTTVTTQCYYQPAGQAEYEPARDKQGKLNGYLRNVAVNKVLLTNERWPFVLDTPLHADLTIAIDVLLNTACFTIMGKIGPSIRSITKTSTQKERLSKKQVRQVLYEAIRDEAATTGLQNIVIQRDGRLFSTEKAGIKDAIANLKADGLLPDACGVTLVEIPESGAASVRLFNVQRPIGGQERTNNPPIGSYFLLGEHDAYLCSTGQEYRHPGTTRPLHVRYVQGTMSFEHVLEDIYALTNLTWTRPEDCAREPITIKLGDIRLREHAGKYDPDALAYEEESAEDTEEVAAQ